MDKIKDRTAVDLKPPVPVGDTIICSGTVSSTYSIDVIPAATAYHWELFPAEAGVVTENAGVHQFLE